MAINARGDGHYIEGDTVRVPTKEQRPISGRGHWPRAAPRPPWGEVIFAQDGFVRVRLTVYGKHSSRYWNETFTTSALDETAKRFAETMRRVN